ncbi:3-phosphoshikimate 1-carboxyvinyltransferase [Polluticoccus soli]|uniref:3-phosphoshikimate 1-carboxyvinyltransferase n=1 Tax=Polluticoccus soli TaxID=3034150 RepID=UPI0023E28818|nr:3-phosphoshikimate 1-carboxyvinyltransferase [Flavipsychrobacter sp. JY13-12]
MQAAISPGNLFGDIQVPASKSMMQRVCAAALLHNGKTTIINPGMSDDDNAALNIIQALGADVEQLDNRIEITSHGIFPKTDSIFCGESGLAARLFIPIAALSNKAIRIDGSGSLITRPLDLFTEVLPRMNVTVQHNSGKLPFVVQGPLQAKDIELDGSLSSQFLSGILFAAGYDLQEPINITVNELKSIPYIDLTLAVLKRFGYVIGHNGYKVFTIQPRVNVPNEITIDIEGDWSSAAVLMVGAALTGAAKFSGLSINSQQADTAILQALNLAGAQVTVDNTIEVKQGPLKGFEFDATHCPDLFPALAILASCCPGESRIHGVHRLIHKESNRIESISDMLEAFEVFHAVEDDALYIEGKRTFEPAKIFSHNDHRIAMAAAIGALRAYDTVYITNADSVNKSYPNFFTDLQKLGAHVRMAFDTYE